MLPKKIQRILHGPQEQLQGRVERSLHTAIDVMVNAVKEIAHDRATEMAAALTYRTIFSLVPIIVLALLIFNLSPKFQSMGGDLQVKLYDYLGLSNLTMPPSSTPADTDGLSDDPAADSQASAPETAIADGPPAPANALARGERKAKAEMKAKLDQSLNEFAQRIRNMDTGKIGAVGIALLVWAAIALVVTVENAFNRIYNAASGRPWHLRIAIYWALITLGPLLAAIGLFLTGQFMAHAQGVLGIVGGQIAQLTALASSWLLLFLLFTLMPNARVERKAALIGSFFTAVLYEMGKWGFGLYVTRFVPYSKVYGSLGLVPLFLMWLYLTWLMVIVGLELTHTIQMRPARRFKHRLASDMKQQVGQWVWLLPLMIRLGRAFEQGQSLSTIQLADELHLPLPAVETLMPRLHHRGLVNRVQPAPRKSGPLYALAMPPDRIMLTDLTDMGRDLVVPAHVDASLPEWVSLERWWQSHDRLVAQGTLAQAMQG